MQALPFILAVSGPMLQGITGLQAGNRNARRLNEQAQEERRATAGEIRRTRDTQRAMIGEQIAAQVSNGLEGGSGTALDALRQSQVEAALDVMEMRRQGEQRAFALRERAKDAKREGRLALVQGVLGAASNVMKMRSDWAQERRNG